MHAWIKNRGPQNQDPGCALWMVLEKVQSAAQLASWKRDTDREVLHALERKRKTGQAQVRGLNQLCRFQQFILYYYYFLQIMHFQPTVILPFRKKTGERCIINVQIFFDKGHVPERTIRERTIEPLPYQAGFCSRT